MSFTIPIGVEKKPVTFQLKRTFHNTTLRPSATCFAGFLVDLFNSAYDSLRDACVDVKPLRAGTIRNYGPSIEFMAGMGAPSRHGPLLQTLVGKTIDELRKLADDLEMRGACRADGSAWDAAALAERLVAEVAAYKPRSIESGFVRQLGDAIKVRDCVHCPAHVFVNHLLLQRSVAHGCNHDGLGSIRAPKLQPSKCIYDLRAVHVPVVRGVGYAWVGDVRLVQTPRAE